MMVTIEPSALSQSEGKGPRQKSILIGRILLLETHRTNDAVQ